MRCVAVTTTNSADAFSGFDNIVQIIDDFTEISVDVLCKTLSTNQPVTLL